MMGLFHLKMAHTNAIWKIFLQPKLKNADENTLINLVGLMKQEKLRAVLVFDVCMKSSSM